MGLVHRYYAYRAVVAAAFTAPVWYLYLIDVTGPGPAGVLQAVWWFGLVAFEVPTGFVADRYGRRLSIAAGNVGLAVAYAGIALASDFAGLAVAFGAAALLSTLRTGADDAWLYDALREHLSTDEFTRVRGRGDAAMFLSSGVTAVVGGYAADATSMSAVFLLTGAGTLLAAPVALSFPPVSPGADGDTDAADPEENALRGERAAPESADTDSEDSESRLGPARAWRLLRERTGAADVRTVVALATLTLGAMWAVNFYVQPVARGLGVPLSGLGWLYGVFTVVGAAVSDNAGRIRDRVGTRRWLRAFPLAMGLLLVGVALVPPLALAVFVVARGGRSVTRTLAGQYVNDRIESVGRATTLSALGMAYNVAGGSVQLAAGWLAETVAPTTALGVFGVALLVGLAATAVVVRWRGRGPGVARAGS